MISAEIGKHVVAKTRYRPVVVATDLDVADLASAVNRSLNVFAAAFDPLHRFAELHGYPSKQSFFGINVQLRSEAAADFRGDHSQFVFRHPDHQRELSSQQVRDLSRRPDCQLLLSWII